MPETENKNRAQPLDQLEAQRAWVIRELRNGRMKYFLAVPAQRDLDKKILKAQRELRK